MHANESCFSNTTIVSQNSPRRLVERVYETPLLDKLQTLNIRCSP